jgi:hypothetical protein
MAEQYIRDFRHHLTFIVVVVLLLAYQVFFVHRKHLKKLDIAHGSESYISVPRLPTIVDSGLTSNKAVVWGNMAGSDECPTMSEAKEYLSQQGMDYYSNFLGGHEPPVYYPIGDVQKTRDTRHKSQSDIGNAPIAGYGGNFMYEAKTVTFTDPQGITRTKVEYVPCPTTQHKLNSSGSCYLPTEGARFVDIEPFNSPQSDRDLLELSR